MMEFIRELINERWIKVTVGGSILQSKVAINGILGEMRNGMDESPLADDLPIYNTTRI